MDPQLLKLVIIFGMIFGGAALVSGTTLLMRGIATRIAGRPIDKDKDDDDDTDGLSASEARAIQAQIKDVVQQLGETQHRLMDVEERLDFAERLLVQKRSGALPGPDN